METSFYRRDTYGVQAAAIRFEQYHEDMQHALEERGGLRRWSSVDRGTFSYPILPPDYLDYLGSSRFERAAGKLGKETRAYGPEVGPQEVRAKIAELENLKHGTAYDIDNIAMVAGAWNGLVHTIDHIIEDLPHAESDRNTVLVIGPTLYQMFWWGSAFGKQHIIAHDYTKTGERHVPALEDIEHMFQERPRAIVFTNPNNPDGLYIPNDVLQAVIERAVEDGVYVIIDEIQNCFPVEGKELRYGPWIQSKNVIRVDGPSKKYSLAEYREGWAIAHPDLLGNRMHGIIGRMSSMMGNAPRAANLALYHVFQNEMDTIHGKAQSVLAPQREIVSAQERLCIELAERITGVIEIQRRDACINLALRTNFPGTDMQLAHELMHEHGALIMPASGYGYRPEDAVLRITFAERETIVRGALAALASVLEKNRISDVHPGTPELPAANLP